MHSLRDFEKASSAITLSDMELFIFPELIYSLVLANIMSPRIWRWRNDKWFSGIESMSPYKRILRIKQYIMDHYVFNLDLETWGLTTKEREIARFKDYVDESVLKQSNALFGYEGDKYYFSVDIRKHFGLDAYNGSVIPYWKTETVEAMDAFIHKANYKTGAGECVSLATLYTAALFIVGKIPLEDIFVLATPLHSQNFIDVQDGVLTNNRRIVTKNMWSNGTELSAKARRALENERVTIVAHPTGIIHSLYRDATINVDAYSRFTAQLHAFLKTALTPEILGNFLRYRRDLQKCFQVRWAIHGKDHFIALERIFAFEANSSYLFTIQTRKNLMNEIEHDEFCGEHLPARIVINYLEEYIRKNPPDFDKQEDRDALMVHFASDCMNAAVAIHNLIEFCIVTPQLPNAEEKTFQHIPALELRPDMTREEIHAYIASMRTIHPMAEYAWHAYRDLQQTSAAPFIKAALERNPVSIEGLKHLSDSALIAWIQALPNESIYEEAERCAQPDEVYNFGRGDGIEKALLCANVMKHNHHTPAMRITINGNDVCLSHAHTTACFTTHKTVAEKTWDLASVNSL